MWGFYVFVYQERIKPHEELAQILTETQANHWSMRGGNELVKVLITHKNSGRTPVQMGITAINLYGVTYAHRRAALFQVDNRDIRVVSASLPVAHRRLLQTLLFTSRAFGGERKVILDPGGDYQYYPPTVIAQGEFDAILVEWGTCYQRSDNATVTDYRPDIKRARAIDMKALPHEQWDRLGFTCKTSLNQIFPI